MHRSFRHQRTALLLFAFLISGCAASAPPAKTPTLEAAPVELVAIGDMPYRPQDIAPFEALLGMIGDIAPDITIHVGDIKGGGSPCTDEVILRQRDYFNQLAGATVFTPGDNEWTDCHRKSAGGYDPRERLAFLREVFYVDDRSLGQQPQKVEQQSTTDSQFSAYVENARWVLNGVRFVSAHVVGSNNGLDPAKPAAVAEYQDRNAASTKWIRDGFAMARAEGAYAVVLAIHADPFQLYGIGGGFLDTLAAISAGVETFGGPVLVIHGDGHEYTLDTPFHGADGRILENAIRVEVPGAADISAVRIRIDPNASNIFAFEVFGPS